MLEQVKPRSNMTGPFKKRHSMAEMAAQRGRGQSGPVINSESQGSLATTKKL